MMIRVAALVFLAALASRAAHAETAEYRLGPEDKLQIKVFDWRTGQGEAYQWQALNGEFVVGSGGMLSLPLLGDVPAADATPSSIARLIGERLQSRIGLAQRPEASVQVIKYRPFYITGGVERPGEYEYRPELSVLQAVSIAGGPSRTRDGGAAGFVRDALVSRGDLRALTVERTELLIRQARLDGEIAEADVITLPKELAGRAGDAAVIRALREEQALFASRRESLRSQSETLNQSRALLDRQITALAAKDASLAHQLSITRQELDQISGLVSQGLVVLPRKLAAEANAAQYESSRLDVQLATLHAQQDIAKASRDIAELRAKARNDALVEAAQVRARLGEVAQRMRTARDLIDEADAQAPVAVPPAGPSPARPTYAIVRRLEGRPTTLQVEDSDTVLPGDVIRVEQTTPDETSGQPTAASD